MGMGNWMAAIDLFVGGLVSQKPSATHYSLNNTQPLGGGLASLGFVLR